METNLKTLINEIKRMKEEHQRLHHCTLCDAYLELIIHSYEDFERELREIAEKEFAHSTVKRFILKEILE